VETEKERKEISSRIGVDGRSPEMGRVRWTSMTAALGLHLYST
jgi:hypothetical protein